MHRTSLIAVAITATIATTASVSAQEEMHQGGVLRWPEAPGSRQANREWLPSKEPPVPNEHQLPHVLVSVTRVHDGLSVHTHDFGTERACEEAAGWVKRVVEFQWSDRSQSAAVTCLPRGRLP